MHFYMLIEVYFGHGVCPECAKEFGGDYLDGDE